VRQALASGSEKLRRIEDATKSLVLEG